MRFKRKYRAAIVGCGKRASAHARVYRDLKSAKLVAACDPGSERRSLFCQEHGIPNQYESAADMFQRENIDLLHIVTGPMVRVPLMALASEFNIPVVLVEKPVAVQSEDWTELTELCANSGTLFLVNFQLHFHPRIEDFRQLILNGAVGSVMFIEATSRSTLLDQGVHLLELSHSFANDAPPVRVIGQVAGTGALDSGSPSPDTAFLAFEFANGIRTHLMCGDCAPSANGRDEFYLHKRIAIYGTKGFIEWSMFNWRYCIDGGLEDSGTHDYFQEDEIAQAKLTKTALRCIAERDFKHPLCLDRALQEFSIVLAAYESAINHRVVGLPCSPTAKLLLRLRQHL